MSSCDMNTITVIGSGLIGRSWAMVFVSGGYSVKIYDNQPGQAAKAIQEIRKQLEELEEAHMLRGELRANQQLALISSHDDLSQALQGAFFVQVTHSRLPSPAHDVPHILKHTFAPQVNPPYYVKLVELVPHPETAAAVMDTTHSLMTKVGQAPIRLKREIDGFALNRVQAAIIAESWRLVQVSVSLLSLSEPVNTLLTLGCKTKNTCPDCIYY
ncbi:lambda-crystallin homolog [Notothenia coriiceps]|uniref:Lambda-crystallin homolog n=1 Tax=Notothenia coriiceps TaxID=8208 RepID=A0A6I9N5P3_9TELE|nr:PREDICTED: lambda-crystallin homolog [Notothenia coriiceps]